MYRLFFRQGDETSRSSEIDEMGAIMNSYRRFASSMMILTAARLSLLWLLGLSLVLLGCEGGGSSAPRSGSGTLELRMVDAPSLIEGIEALTVTYTTVSVHKAGSESSPGSWIEVLNADDPGTDPTFELLELVNGVDALLAFQELDAGLYTQIRIVVDRNHDRIKSTFFLDYLTD